MNELVIDKMKRWQIITIAVVTIIFFIAIIGIAFTYDRRTLENIETTGNLTSQWQEEFIVINHRIDLYKRNKWANIYFIIKPEKFTHKQIKFHAIVELHKITDGTDNVSTREGDYTTSCHGYSCSDILIVKDDSIEQAMYVLVMRIQNAHESFDREVFAYGFSTISASEGQTIFDIVTTSMALVTAVIVMIIFFLYNIKTKKKKHLYFWFNAILCIGCLVFNNPLVFLELIQRFSWMEMLDDVFMELYIFIMIVWTFFHIDHLKLLGINESYPVFQWVFRAIVLLGFFTSEGVYFSISILNHRTQLVGDKDNVINDIRSIRDFLEFALIFWIIILLCKSFSLIQNPINRKRLLFLSAFSGMFSAVCLIQLFFSSKAFNNLPIPTCLVKLINTYIVTLILICFQQKENNLYYQKEMVNEYQDNDPENEYLIDEFNFV